MWIAAFFAGVFMGGVIMALLASSARTELFEQTQRERLAAYGRGYRDGCDDLYEISPPDGSPGD